MSTTADELREEVRRRYAETARAVAEATGGCGSWSCCGGDASDAAKLGRLLYDAEQLDEVPDAAVLAALGCGNPTAVAELREGETVLDLGSGGGIDVILSARRVGPDGTAYGLDTDKAAVLREIARVLKPGGRVGVSDIVAEDRLAPEDRAKRGSYVGCIAGALSAGEYVAGLEAAGLEDVRVELTHRVADGMHSAIVEARKPRSAEPKEPGPLQRARTASCC